jgi:hypothetical protein
MNEIPNPTPEQFGREHIRLTTGEGQPLQEETFAHAESRLTALTEGPGSTELSYADSDLYETPRNELLNPMLSDGERVLISHPNKGTDHTEAVIGGDIDPHASIGRVWEQVNEEEGSMKWALKVVSLNAVGKGIAISEHPDLQGIPPTGYITFSAERTSFPELSFSGYIWLKGDRTIGGESEIGFAPNKTAGFEFQKFAASLGLGRLWQAAMSRYDYPGNIPEKMDATFEFSDQMAQDLQEGIDSQFSGNVDQSVRED